MKIIGIQWGNEVQRVGFAFPLKNKKLMIVKYGFYQIDILESDGIYMTSSSVRLYVC